MAQIESREVFQDLALLKAGFRAQGEAANPWFRVATRVITLNISDT
jgi:hypothetical protein